MAQAQAFVNGRDYVVPNDVAKVFPAVAGHRLMLNAKARMNQVTTADVIQEILDQVKKPREK